MRASRGNRVMASRSPQSAVVEAFSALIDAMQTITEAADLNSLVQAGARLSGSEDFLLGCLPSRSRGERMHLFSNLPFFDADGHDPSALIQEILVACRGRLTPFPMGLLAGDANRFVASGCLDPEGWVVPLHIPGVASGFCCFRSTPETGDIHQLQFVAIHAFEAACRIVQSARAVHRSLLTPRQRQCVELAAKGKSDWISGQILGLAAGTVHKYLEQAKARYGVSSRTELVVRALYEGHIRFHDLLD